MTDAYDIIIIGTGAAAGRSHGTSPTGKKIISRARRLAPREPQNWSTADVFIDNRYISEDTWYDADAKAFQPQITTSSAVPRSSTARRSTACGPRTSARSITTGSRPLADRLRRDGALLHARRAALPGARCEG